MVKSIGVWGYGIVGKSAVDFLTSLGTHAVSIYDQKAIPEHDQQQLHLSGVTTYQPDNLSSFLETNQYILPSPGIDLRPYQQYAHKWISELDLFQLHNKTPVIAITGSIGKTSVTHLLSAVAAKAGLSVQTGGNIGIGMLELAQQSMTSDWIILEVSSFQLELTTQFAPAIAVWTNLFANHLDRHGTLHDYFVAKWHLLTHQKPDQKALLPLSLLQQPICTCHPVATLPSQLFFFTHDLPTSSDRQLVDTHAAGLFYKDNDAIRLYKQGTDQLIIPAHQLPTISFAQNWFVICATMHLMNMQVTDAIKPDINLALPDYRFQKVGSWDGIDFYNDSKSTTAQSTLAAVQSLPSGTVHLFLGGVGKGVDRTPLIAQLKEQVKFIYCFGGEAATLHEACNQYGITSSQHATLEAAFAACIKNAGTGEHVLFSPAGASFDLFANYQERGKRFDELVAGLR